MLRPSLHCEPQKARRFGRDEWLSIRDRRRTEATGWGDYKGNILGVGCVT
jgi:hypothetical protein